MADPFVLVPVADPMIGTVMGSFVITRLLGRGGMGAVYLAQHKAAAHIRCVYKTILAHLSHNAVMISRFNTETEAVGRLSHENIVELKDFGVLPNGQMYMQFEFIDGTPLDRFLAEWGGLLSLHRAAYLAFQVCDALDHAHAAGVIHRDLKPDNLLVVVQDKKRVPRLVKLVDFGISKVVRTGSVQTISGMSMGTPYFMSVEQYANAAEASAKSDVYSLAIILWLMITGELPWGRPEPTVLYHLQRTVVPTRPPEHVMPAGVARILLRCFSIEPDDRPTMQELAVELAAVIPATDDAPSGGAILLHIAPHFLASSPEHARTVPRSAVANPDLVAAQLWPPVRVAAAPTSQGDGRLPPLNVDTRSGQVVSPEPVAAPDALPSAPVPESMPSASVAVLSVHASARTVGAPAAQAPEPPGAAAAPPLSKAEIATEPAGPGARAPRSRGPVVAALPTGLISQKHIAQEPPIDILTAVPRVRSIVAAAEIDLAAGTPGPAPYAHAELPAVLISNTQLSGVPSQPSLPVVQPPRGPEAPPVLVLPQAVRSTMYRLRLAIAAALCMFAVMGIVAYVWRGSRVVANRGDEGSASTPSFAAVPNGVVPPIDAEAAPEARPAVAAAPRRVDVDPIDAGATASSGSATTTSPAVNNAATEHPNNTAATKSPPDTPVSSSPSDTSRVAPPRQAPNPRTLRARQLEARASGARTGNLHLLVTPWAVCWVDGERIDQTPCMLDDVPVGRYRVRLENGVAHKVETLTATVTAGQTTTIERTW